jgi:hypothetical protein
VLDLPWVSRVTVYLVRHARAGDRSRWTGDDWLRPLSVRGHRQAYLLIKLLADAKFDRILSSPYVRCMQTVVPIAGQGPSSNQSRRSGKTSRWGPARACESTLRCAAVHARRPDAIARPLRVIGSSDGRTQVAGAAPGF